MSKQEFLMLAHRYRENKDDIGGSFVSEKLDGFRCFWDGGITRGKHKKDIPWANHEKDDRFLDQVESLTCTGLWSRYGNIIHAPDFFLDSLPKNIFLDGELWIARQSFQLVRAIASRLPKNRDNNAWRKVKFIVIDSPPAQQMFKAREIETTQFTKVIPSTVLPEIIKSGAGSISAFKYNSFEHVYHLLHENLGVNDHCILHRQAKLPIKETDAKRVVNQLLNAIYNSGGEGLMLRRPHSVWVPERTRVLLKVKPFDDDEAVVIGYVTGRETDKGSKLLGLMGALKVRYKNKHGKFVEFELSGFTDEERVLKCDTDKEDKMSQVKGVSDNEKVLMAYPGAYRWAMMHPGIEIKEGATWITNPMFPIGSAVTFRFRELSDDGVPKEARYWRK